MERPILAALMSCKGTVLTDEEKYIFSRSNPLGVTLFSRNIVNKKQLKNLITDIRQTIGREDVLIAVDQEGGRVRRLKGPNFRAYVSQYAIGSLPEAEARRTAELHARLISCDFNDVGLNVNFAPVLDIAYPQTTEALRSRCFSSRSDIVAELGKIMVDQYMQNGILPCIKHLPGHGLAVTDPHMELPVVDISLERLQTELAPFKSCRHAPLGMTAHILFPAIDKHNPLTQSKDGIRELIRGQIGFSGLLLSDAINMKALSGSVADRALSSLRAGCDAVCYCMGRTEELQALADCCPKLSDDAMERLDKAVQILHNKPRQNCIKADAAEYTRLKGNATPYRKNFDVTEILHKQQQGNKKC